MVQIRLVHVPHIALEVGEAGGSLAVVLRERVSLPNHPIHVEDIFDGLNLLSEILAQRVLRQLDLFVGQLNNPVLRVLLFFQTPLLDDLRNRRL